MLVRLLICEGWRMEGDAEWKAQVQAQARVQARPRVSGPVPGQWEPQQVVEGLRLVLWPEMSWIAGWDLQVLPVACSDSGFRVACGRGIEPPASV